MSGRRLIIEATLFPRDDLIFDMTTYLPIRRKNQVFFSLFCLCVCALLCTGAQADTPEANNSTKKIHFGFALSYLSKRTQAAFVCENTPFEPFISFAKWEKIKDQTSPDGAIEKTAEAFDYSVTKVRGVYVWKKIYTVPEDLPFVTVDEVQASLEDAVRLLNAFSPHISEGTNKERELLGEFIRSLSDEQMTALHREGIPLSALKPRQQALVRRVALYFYVQSPARQVEAALKMLREATRPETEYALADERGSAGLGYYYLAFGKPQWEPLKREFYHVGGSYLGYTPRPGFNIEELPKAITRPVLADATPTTATTLAAAVNTLQKRDRPEAVNFTVDVALGPKPVTLSGESYASADALMDAFAVVYGLRVKREAGAVQRLTRRALPQITQPEELPEALRSVYPESVLRAMHGDILFAQHQELSETLFKSVSQNAQAPTRDAKSINLIKEKMARDRETMLQVDLLGNKLADSSGALRAVAVRLLEEDIKPVVNAQANKKSPYAALPPTPRSQIALVFLCMSGMEKMPFRGAPEYITRYDQIVLSGGLDKDKGRDWFGLCLDDVIVRGPLKIKRGVSIGHVRYPLTD